MFSAGAFDPSSNVESQQIIILEDGVPQELLYQQTITDIKVDGSTINGATATSSRSVWMISSMDRNASAFTKDNSPLPSIMCGTLPSMILTGQVYFATVNGLVAYGRNCNSPQDNLDGFMLSQIRFGPDLQDATIDDLTSNANVKITDIEGNLVFETHQPRRQCLWDTKPLESTK